MRKRPTPRRGILLLIVLSLLILFVLIGFTFLATTGQFRRGTLPSKQHEMMGDAPTKVLDMALAQVLRGPKPSERSPLRGHDLLGDLYGDRGFIGIVGGAVWGPASGDPAFRQFITLNITVDPNYPAGSFEPGTFSGSVLTFENGRLGGKSTRIVSFQRTPTTNSYAITVETPEFEGESQSRLDLTAADPQVGLVGARVIVNGRPFNGTGAGYFVPPAPAVPNLDATVNLGDGLARNLALLPNYAAHPPTAPSPSLGGLNESYDAVDFQNMFLAWVTPNVPFNRFSVSPIRVETSDENRLISNIIPSFHRPELLHFWAQGDYTALRTTDPAVLSSLLRTITLRPNWVDHPKFSGSNPYMQLNPTGSRHPLGTGYDPADLVYKLVTGTHLPDPGDLLNRAKAITCWDVDNDQDGVNDSVWLDLGFPVQFTRDGRAYKPLFAVLCVDLDGRVNLNAHGSVAHLSTNPTSGYTQSVPMSADIAGFPPPPTVNPFLWPELIPRPPTPTDMRILGHGFGPADICLRAVTGQPFATDRLPNPVLGLMALLPQLDLHDALLQLRYASPSDITIPPQPPAPGLPGINDDSVVTGWDMQIAPNPNPIKGDWKRPGLNSNWLVSPGLYGTPVDLQAKGTTVLNPAGQPRAIAPPWAIAMGQLEPIDDPYELNLLAPKPTDRIFRDADLERFLRGTDFDTPVLDERVTWEAAIRAIPPGSLPSTPPVLHSDVIAAYAPILKNLVTTRSFDIPTPNVVAPSGLVPFMLEGQIPLNPPPPIPNPNAPPIIARTLVGPNATYETMLRQFVVSERARLQRPPLTDDELDLQIRAMIAPEMRRGEKFNLNRLFGQGLDDNRNGVVDEPVWGPLATPLNTEPLAGVVTAPSGVSKTYALVNDDPLPAPVAPLQQSYARHLYCLAMFLREPGLYTPAPDPSDPVALARLQERVQLARTLAQWAVNVVDFFDADSIMTPFEFDWNPYDGWDATGNIIGDLAVNPQAMYDPFGNHCVVWGAERPDLLITETLALHDRRTEDTDYEPASRDRYFNVMDDGAPAKTRDPNDPNAPPYDPRRPGRDPLGNVRADQEFDQRMLPISSLFVELYNPWAGNTAPSFEYSPLWDTWPDDGTPRYGVALDATVPGTGDPTVPGSADPVWRMLVVDGLKYSEKPGFANDYVLDNTVVPPQVRPRPDAAALRNPDDPRMWMLRERSIFFANVENANPAIFEGRRVHYRTSATRLCPILPGRYGVVGPRGRVIEEDVGQRRVRRHVTPIGLHIDEMNPEEQTQLAETRRIELVEVMDRNNTGISLIDENRVDVLRNYRHFVSNDFPADEITTLPVNQRDIQPAVPVVIDSAAKFRPGQPDIVNHKYVENSLGISDPLDETYKERAASRTVTVPADVDVYTYTPGGTATDLPLDDPDQIAGDDIDYNGEVDFDQAAGTLDERDPDFRFPLPVRSLGTTPNYKRIHLQRLANPLARFHPQLNPYRTIDSAWVDLNVFNGATRDREALERDGLIYRASGTPTEGPDDRPGVQNPWWSDSHTGDEPYNAKKFATRFRTRQRGDDSEDFLRVFPNSDPQYFVDDFEGVRENFLRSFWRSPTISQLIDTSNTPLELGERERTVESGGEPRHYFPFVLSHSLGFASLGRWPDIPMQDPRNPGNQQKPMYPDDRVHRPRLAIWGNDRVTIGESARYAGLPRSAFPLPPHNSSVHPFPWMVWNNRPFANPLEILHCPYTSSFELLGRFDYLDRPETVRQRMMVPYNPYVPRPGFERSIRSRFEHLPNFFHLNPLTSPNLSRIFDYLEVPSPFEGTQKWYDSADGNYTTEFRMPFHRLSRFREPGRVNLNTVTDRRIWEAIMFGNPARPIWQAVQASRRGYLDPNARPTSPTPAVPPAPDPTFLPFDNPASVDNPLAMDVRYPTRFTNPFRTGNSAELMPNILDLRKPIAAQVNLLRPFPDQTTLPGRELFGPHPVLPDLSVNPPIFPDPVTFDRPYNDGSRNSFFRYYGHQRLGQTVTNHSNCFAIWITVGYFEVEPWLVGGVQTFDEAHPDGFMLGQEIGFDLGEHKRHRAFYIIDRSIPVGYRTGWDVNAWDAVMLKRFTE